MESRRKFLCDHMLGTLARWLRILGFDTVYPSTLEDGELVSLAGREGRILLTRDRDLGKRRDTQALYISSDVLDEQVEQVLRELRLTLQEPMSRCPVCNGALVEVSKEEVSGKVPDGVYEHQREFWRCPECGKHYWQGSHWDRMRKKIEEYEAFTRRHSSSRG